MAMSDAESDSYSLLEAPRPSTQALMLQAMLEGRLAQLVLEDQADLSRSIALCLEVLGIGTSTAQRQSAAAKSLVALCTHRKLRPAVDNLLVLRRLCRIIELTDSATALAAAVEALFAVADDAAWQSKSGSTADVLREALTRCVNTISGVAKTTSKGVKPESRAAKATSKDVNPGSGTAAILLDSAVDMEQVALAAAAAAALRPAVLPLLSCSQLVEAASALACCLASGLGGPEVLAALAAVLRNCPAGEHRKAAAAALVDTPGAVASLVRAMVASGAQQQQMQLLVEVSVQKVPEVTGPGNGGSKPGKQVMRGASSPVQLTAPARDAFYSLADVLVVGCGMARFSTAGVSLATLATLKALSSGGVAAILPLLRLDDPEIASSALHALLVLEGCGTGSAGMGPVTKALLAASPEERQHSAAGILTAAKSLLKSAALDSSDGACATALLQLFSELLAEGTITVEELRQQAPGLTEAAVGVLTGDKPGPAWSGLFTYVYSSDVLAADTSPPILPSSLLAAAVNLACPLLARAAVADSWGAWLPATSITAAMIGHVNGTSNNFIRFGPAGIKCLTLSLQLAPPEKLWVDSRASDKKRLAKGLKKMLHKSSPSSIAMIQLVAVALVSMWSPIAHSRTMAESLLDLATCALKQAAALSSSEGASPAEQLAVVAGVINSVIACMCPQRAVSGDPSQPLSPGLPERLLCSVNGNPSCLLDLYQPASMTSVGQRTMGYASDIGADHTTIAATTAQPLLQALGAAMKSLTERIAVLVGATRDADVGGAAMVGASAVMCAALRVAGNAAEMMAMCIPPGKKGC